MNIESEFTDSIISKLHTVDACLIPYYTAVQFRPPPQIVNKNPAQRAGFLFLQFSGGGRRELLHVCAEFKGRRPISLASEMPSGGLRENFLTKKFYL